MVDKLYCKQEAFRFFRGISKLREYDESSAM
jgi:hypothetical protein